MIRSRPSRPHIIGAAVFVAAFAAAALPWVASAGQTAATEQVSAPVPQLTWSGCDLVFQCATAKVPLDYRDPQGKTISLALIRQPARKPDQRIGSLLVNPGGPGGALTPLPAGPPEFGWIAANLGAQVQDRFDIVSIDPRGVGGSDPLTCPAAPGVPQAAQPSDPYPTEGQYQQWFAYDDTVRANCAATGGDILNHMSTADVARDMDLIRQALGDRQLSYYGLSYGSFLGETYAAMFPDRVRALAIDGVLDPVAYTTGQPGDDRPFTTRMGSADGGEEALTSALARCDQVSFLQCPLTGNAMGRWDRVRASLAKQPLALPGGTTITDKTFLTLTQQAISLDHGFGLPVPGYPALATMTKLLDVLRFGLDTPNATHATENLAGFGQVDFAAPRDMLLDQLAKVVNDLRASQSTSSTGTVNPLQAISCPDSVNPTDRNAWITAANDADAKAPGFGSLWTWYSSGCVGWPGSSADAYHGPFRTTTATPLLIIANSHDPNTNITGARATNALFDGSRLVEVQTWGHTSLGKSNNCLQPVVTAYLVSQQLPAEGLTCKPDAGLWGEAP